MIGQFSKPHVGMLAAFLVAVTLPVMAKDWAEDSSGDSPRCDANPTLIAPTSTSLVGNVAPGVSAYNIQQGCCPELWSGHCTGKSEISVAHGRRPVLAAASFSHAGQGILRYRFRFDLSLLEVRFDRTVGYRNERVRRWNRTVDQSYRRRPQCSSADLQRGSVDSA